MFGRNLAPDAIESNPAFADAHTRSPQAFEKAVRDAENHNPVRFTMTPNEENPTFEKNADGLSYTDIVNREKAAAAEVTAELPVESFAQSDVQKSYGLLQTYMSDLYALEDERSGVRDRIKKARGNGILNAQYISDLATVKTREVNAKIKQKMRDIETIKEVIGIQAEILKASRGADSDSLAERRLNLDERKHQLNVDKFNRGDDDEKGRSISSLIEGYAQNPTLIRERIRALESADEDELVEALHEVFGTETLLPFEWGDSKPLANAVAKYLRDNKDKKPSEDPTLLTILRMLGFD